MLFVKRHGRVIYSQCFHGFGVACFATVDGNEMKDASMSSAMHSQAHTDGHDVMKIVDERQMIFQWPHVTCLFNQR